MFSQKCPGQDTRYWTADDVHEEECPNCGEMIEFFKTDIRLRCRNCKTRVANSRFDMGCAQWCAYAEQCLGAGARGLKKKPLRTVLEEEVDRLAKNWPKEKVKIKESIVRAEELLRVKELDILPVITAIVIITLKKLDCLDDAGTFLQTLADEHAMPRLAIDETLALIDNYSSEKLDGELEIIMKEVIPVNEYETGGCIR